MALDAQGGAVSGRPYPTTLETSTRSSAPRRYHCDTHRDAEVPGQSAAHPAEDTVAPATARLRGPGGGAGWGPR